MCAFARVLRRNASGIPTLWQCSSCGQPFDLGWGSRCNRCIAIEKRHAELMAALAKLAPKGGS